MRSSMLLPTPLLYTISLLLATTPNLSQAKPYPKDEALDDVISLQNSTQFLQPRCNNPCGWSGQLCCSSGEACYTDSSNQAQCGGAATSGGYWQYYTTTVVQTDLVTHTSIYSSYIGGTQVTSTSPQTTATCNYALNESPCGSICCASGQYCYTSGQCAAAAGGSSGNSYYTTATTGSYSAPLRPTTGTVVVVTNTISPTTTVPFQTPVATGANATITSSQTSGGGLSGGAIAGIVIGVIAGILLLLLICLACCFKAAFDSLLAIFGLGRGRRERRETEYIEEYHHHHGSAAGAGSRRWYGDRPRPATVVEERRKTGRGWGGAAGVAAGLAGLGAVLGLKRKRDERRAKTEYTGSTSDYTYEYTTTSSASSDDRTRRYGSRR